MMYLDAAYLAKFYLAEPDSVRVRQAIFAAPASACCLHGRLETVSVFHRKLREGTVSASEFEAHCRQFETDCAGGMWKWLPVSENLVTSAEGMIRQLPATVFLRASDALHLTCAREHGFTSIHSSDKHLLNAAPHFGLTGVSL
jgi:predicted nucleic acid-binding protein